MAVRAAKWWKNSGVSPRAKWKFRPRGRAIIGTLYGQHELSPGDKWSEVHYVHHAWRDIPKGKVVLEVSWPIYQPREDGKLIAKPRTKLEVDILPATKERVRALCQRLDKTLSRDDGTEEERLKRIREVVQYVKYTKHAGLAPVEWRLIESFPEASPVLAFIPLVYAAGEDKGAVNRRLVKLACDPDYPELDSIFWYWRREKMTLSADELGPSLRSENVWTRAMTCATFPRKCGTEWTERLYRDLREAQQPLPDKQFARLVADLDDDAFDVRERATRELMRHYDRVRAQLVKAVQGRRPKPGTE